MEGAAIAHVCRKNGVRCRMVKCVTNVAGKGAMTGQYEVNRQYALGRLTEALGGYLR
jgi:nucleoside phosphorylase